MDQKHSLGNLALLSPQDQRGAKNAAPIEKKAIYNQSLLVLSKTVTGESITSRMDKARDSIYVNCGVKPNWSLENWNSEAITSRQEFYKAFITAIVSMELEIPD